MKKKSKLKNFLTFGGSGFFVLFMVAVFLTPAVPLTCGKALGHYPVLMSALSECEASREALGSDIRVATIGLNTGSCSGGSDQWRASGRMPVQGSKGKGTLRYAMSKSGDKWTVHAMTLNVGGKNVNLFSAGKGCKKLEFRKGSGGSSDTSETASGGESAARRGASGPALSAEDEKDRQLSGKLQPFIKLTNTFTSRVYQSRNRYASWLKDFDKGPTCKERHIYGLYTISEPESYLKEVEKVQGGEPRLEDLEEGAGKYTEALKKLEPLLKKADRYYSQKDYKEDKCAQAKEMHPQLVEAFKEFEVGEKILGKAIEKYNTGLHYRLLERIAAEHGKTSEQYYHKKVTLDARALLMVLRFESQEKEPDHEKVAAEVKKFDTLVLEMEENVKNGSATSSFRRSANSYVQAVKEMMRRMKEGKPFSNTEKRWLSGGSGWMVGGSFDKVNKQFNSLIDDSNRVRFR